MADTVLDQIVASLQNSGAELFPNHSKLKLIRIAGHLPKPGHCTYEIILDFSDARERLSARIYRDGKTGSPSAQDLARRELTVLHRISQACAAHNLDGLPQAVGDFTTLGAVVSRRIQGLSVQSIVVKAALLPNFKSTTLVDMAAAHTGNWLRRFHNAAASDPEPIDGKALFREIEQFCTKGQQDGLAKDSTQSILEYAAASLADITVVLPSSAVLNEFVPLNVMISEQGVGFSEVAGLTARGHSLHDIATFLAATELLEKYPFCNRRLTSRVQESFLEAYGLNPEEQQLLTVFKLRELLRMFAQGRTAKEAPLRKKIMWSNVMKRCIQTAARRSMAPAA